MSTLFGEYELLVASSLFDAAFYRSTNPEIAALNVDPLLHYLENGSRERRDPSAAFDTAHYLKQCATLGEAPSNALSHYLTVGIGRGLTPAPGAAALPALLYVDIPRVHDGVADAPVHAGLSIVGWGLTASGTGSVQIALNGVKVTSVRCGLRRPDVVAAHPARRDALLSGYAVHLPPKALPLGRQQITVTLIDNALPVKQLDFLIDVQEATDTRGPWSLRRKMRQAEVDFKRDLLQGLGAAPLFIVALRGSAGAAAGALKRTLSSLRRQSYGHWKIRRPRAAAPAPGSRSSATRRLVMLLAPGDELGCDALLEFALASGRDPGADLLYCDDRRRNALDGRQEAFFKPAWSPDLLLSTNYIGRAWCADEGVLERAGLTSTELASGSDYALALRLTESAQRICHVPLVLCQRDDSRSDDGTQERQALGEALKRRKISGEVMQVSPGTYRVQRPLRRARDRVSIIIPTCGASGLVKTCIESLRAQTAYRAYDIVVVENVGRTQPELTRWLRRHADVVVPAKGPFNWSLYNNQAAAQARGQYLLFLNDDIEVIDSHWLHALLEHAQRPEVGVVGARLLYPDRSVQHAGVMLDRIGRGRHAFRHLDDADPGYFGLAASERNVISVTGACLMTRRATFDALGGFDGAHAVINNDLDYCLRAWESGLSNIYTPHARLVHHELASRSLLPERYDTVRFAKRWARVITSGDPYFNPNLSRDDESFAIDREPLEIVYAGRPLYARDTVRRILAVKIDHIGDCVTALPALRRLQQHFPAAAITVLAASSTLPVWRNEAVVADTLEFNFFRARSGDGKYELSGADLEQLRLTLQAKRFDLAVDLRKQPDSRFVLPLSGAPLLAGFEHQGRFPWLDMALEWDEDVPLRGKHGHVGEDLVALVDMIAAQGEPERRAAPAAPTDAPALSAAAKRRLAGKPLVCVHPCAGSPMRQWPLRHFSALIDLLLEHKDCHVALIGGGDETEVGRQVRSSSRQARQVIDLTGALSLEELMKLLATAAVFVGNNSGPQHLAAGLGVATIGIHSGVVDAREWGPVGPRAVALRRDMSCSPCYLEEAKDCPRQLACLEHLPVAAVYSQCRQMLAAVAA